MPDRMDFDPATLVASVELDLDNVGASLEPAIVSVLLNLIRGAEAAATHAVAQGAAEPAGCRCGQCIAGDVIDAALRAALTIARSVDVKEGQLEAYKAALREHFAESLESVFSHCDAVDAGVATPIGGVQ